MESRERGLIRLAKAGSLESNDLLVLAAPFRGELVITVKSVVQAQYGEHIEKLVREVLAEEGVEEGEIRIEDRGALDFAIRARVKTAVKRGRESHES